MPNFLASFDLRFELGSFHSDFMRIAMSLDWSPWIECESGFTYRLPGTTLYGEFIDLDSAYAALEEARELTQYALGKCVFMEKIIVAQVEEMLFSSNVTK